MENNYFTRLAAINVANYVEKKGQFRYLSWPFAVSQLRQADPTATWEVRRFDGLPYLRTETGYFVEVAVTVQSVTLSQVHPVLDARNRPIPEPTCFDINTSIARCLVKGIALHGLGIALYANEDLPPSEASNDNTATEQPQAVTETISQPKANVTSLPNESKASLAQIRYIEQLLEKTGTAKERLLEFFQVSHLSELTVSAASRAIKSLEKQRRAA